MRAFDRLKRSLRKRFLHRRFGDEWDTNGGNFQKRRYASYADYLEHQAAKLETHSFGNYDADFRRVLRERLSALDINWPGQSVLCLGARIGTEVKAFLDLGAAATGIDLNPGENNPHVVFGDFHHLPAETNSLDVVYTNSLDHAFDLDRVAKEVRRVLKPNGVFIVEAVHGRDRGINPGFFESFFWENIEALVGAIGKAGFAVSRRTPITAPWPGEQICLHPST
ncbi:MAG: class I SAM-dependent methyltransferase [Chthoniobacterales bacterium]